MTAQLGDRGNTEGEGTDDKVERGQMTKQRKRQHREEAEITTQIGEGRTTWRGKRITAQGRKRDNIDRDNR